jgi:hypothetical protein
LNDVKYAPILCVNLISLNKTLDTDIKIKNNGVNVSLNYNHVRLNFVLVINATDGCVTGDLMKQLTISNIKGFSNA